MSEHLVSRVKRLVAGSVNGLVDTIEKAAPESVMREAIREIDRATDEVRDALGRAIANRHHASRRLMEATSKHEELAEKARFAVDQGRDELAEAAIARQIDMEAQLPVLEAALSDLSSEQHELEGYVSALIARKREMEADLTAFVESREASCADGENGSSDNGSGHAVGHGLQADRRADKAESAFNRVLQGASGIGATARADSETAAKLAELEAVTRAHRVQERLAAMKATKGEV